jgi:hypothetical protein
MSPLSTAAVIADATQLNGPSNLCAVDFLHRPSRQGALQANRRRQGDRHLGAGVYAGLTITANILMSLAIDKFGWFGLGVHPLSAGRIGGAALMVSGIVLISRY